jgi:ribonuclease R
MVSSSRPLPDQILDFLSRHPEQTFKPSELAHRLELGQKALGEVRSALRELARTNQIRREGRKRFGSIGKVGTHHCVGTVRFVKHGGAIVELLPPHEGDVRISQRFLGTAMEGDTVSVAIFPEPAKPAHGKKESPVTEEDRTREGEVVRVLKRGQRPVVGEFRKSKHFFFVAPDDRRIREVYIPKGKTHGARPGSKVVAVVEDWPSPHSNPEGKIVEVLGKTGEVRAEMASVVRMFGLPTGFPDDVLAETEKISDRIPKSEFRNRLDLREETCFTIDPEDAKDFDDAVSLEFLPSGDFKLGVHIADVSYYVREGTALDQEALKRGTSVYLADGVIPMLPENLSNNICSLRPHEDRLTYSAMMVVTPRGTVKDYAIERSIIRSKRRFAYEEVQRILETGKGELANILLPMHSLAKTLLAKRLKEGSIDFETAETKFRFDAHGMPTEIVKKVRQNSNRLIEEFMLLANKSVATHVARRRSERSPQTPGSRPSTHSSAEQLCPSVYRVHDTPNPDKIEELASFVNQFGYSLAVGGNVTSKALQKLLRDVKGKEEEAVINQVAIRAMAKAIYSERNIGHFGLGFKHYTHFTSPIRRYPDLIVHRLLKEYSDGMPMRRRQQLMKALPEICAHSSQMEQRAMEAERDSVRVMQVEYMKRHLGEEFHAVISGVTHFGIFVEVTDLLVEGLIRVRDLEDDYYVFDEKNYAFIGRRHRKRYRLGDKVRVQVVRVDPEEREIDFAMVE